MIVHESTQDLQTPTGAMRTYVYAPTESGRPPRRDPGLILYSEIFQQTAPVRRLAVQLASLGYVVVVPEIYHAHEAPGTVLGYDNAGRDRGNALKLTFSMADFDADAQVLVNALKANSACNGRLGAVGICLGGHLAFRAALHPEIRAAACFYPTDLQGGPLGGSGNDTLARASAVKGELLLVFGRQDPHVPGDGRRIIYETLNQAGVWFTWHEFNAAHAFLRDEGERYDPAAARLAMDLAADLLSRCL